MRRGNRAAALAGVAVVLAGCGGHAKPAPSRAEFVAAADAACGSARTPQARYAALLDLRRPRDERALVERWLRAERTVLRAGQHLRDATPEDDRTLLEILLVVARSKAEGYALRLGAKGCAAQLDR